MSLELFASVQSWRLSCAIIGTGSDSMRGIKNVLCIGRRNDKIAWVVSEALDQWSVIRDFLVRYSVLSTRIPTFGSPSNFPDSHHLPVLSPSKEFRVLLPCQLSTPQSSIRTKAISWQAHAYLSEKKNKRSLLDRTYLRYL
jgi:hypothetical protein